MIKVGIVLVPNVYLYSVGGMMDAFQIANDHISRQQGAQTRLFGCRTVGVSDAAVVASGGVTLQPDMTIAEAESFDLIYVPAFCYKGMNIFENMVSEQASLLCWLSECWQKGSVLSANCTGTFLLAETGLLNRRRATTAWWLERSFRRRFPRVDLDANALLAEDDRLLTTGAMTAHLNMAIHLIGHHAGPHLAAICARTMLIDIGPNSQRPYQELLEHNLSVDPLVAKAQYWLQNNVGAAIDQKTLARRMNVSQRTLIRRFNAELGIAPLTYLQHVRIETAKKMLENTAAPLTEIVGRVGYFDLSSFTRLFKRKTGLTPYAYRQRFGQLGSSRLESVGQMPR
ncbi:MAG: helix-turn-helix domain-containing protein [Rhodospirillaceae bacterium]|nr:helix-turn-helix domain-containing protein [Rhodospirillaceae bacterium]